MKYLATLLIILFICSLALYMSGYHGPRLFEGKEISEPPPQGIVIENARNLIGTPYDLGW